MKVKYTIPGVLVLLVFNACSQGENDIIESPDEIINYTNNWRLPNAKELESIVDYTRSSHTTNFPSIDPLFETTEISDPDGNPGQYPFFWTGTTHLDDPNPYSSAACVAFGEGQGKMNGTLMDVHGAGC